MFKGKPTKVIITGNAKEEFDELNKVVGEEIAKGITSSDHQTLLNSIKPKIDILYNLRKKVPGQLWVLRLVV